MRDAILAAPGGKAALRNTWKVAGLVVLLAAIAACAAFAGAVWLGERKMRRSVEVRVVPVAFVKGAAALARGKYLFESRGCSHCHGDDGAGRVFIDEPGGPYVRAPNLTSGPGSAVAGYDEGDWVRAIRHGIDPKGHALLVMPSEDYSRMDDVDFAALVAYVRSLPPRSGEAAAVRFPLLVKALYGVGRIRDAAEKIDHRMPPPVPIAAAASVEYGEYAAAMCVGCHGATFAGGPIPGSPPDWPAAANLTPRKGSAMARYDTPEAFAAMMRSGSRPDGSKVSDVMPFESLRRLDDTELAAIYAYLKTLAPRAAGSR
jgi:mono/diheme cytochrome c family protein